MYMEEFLDYTFLSYRLHFLTHIYFGYSHVLSSLLLEIAYCFYTTLHLDLNSDIPLFGVTFGLLMPINWTASNGSLWICRNRVSPTEYSKLLYSSFFSFGA
jgi:hypothetical protein